MSDTPAAGTPGETPAAVDAAAPDAGNLLAATAPATDRAWLGDQFHVKTEAGDLDFEASARKLGESYKALAARMRETGAPPKEAGEYAFNIPDEAKAALGDWTPEADPMLADFRDKALGAGLTQKQFDFVVGEYLARLPQIGEAKAEASANAAETALRAEWKDESAFKSNMVAAHKALTQYAGDEAATLVDRYGNDPAFIKLMAKVGGELREDTSPTATPGAGSPYAGLTREGLMAHEAYTNPRHADHALVSSMVRAAYEKQYGNTPVL